MVLLDTIRFAGRRQGVSLAEQLRAQRPKVGTRCYTCQYLESLNPENRAEWDEVMTDARINSKTISNHLETLGIEIGYYGISRHRRGDCRGTEG